MRVLITGAGGQLGRQLVAHCVAIGDDVRAFGRPELDVTDVDAVARTVGAEAPELVINTAAWTEVDACEADPRRAFRDNADAVEHLRLACDSAGAHLVQLSTDYVFDGTLDRAYREDDTPNPMSVYGRSKLAGELAAGESATVVRTSWVSGEHGSNVVKTVLRMLAADSAMAFVADQRGNPTFTSDLAPMVRRLGGERRSGVVHVTNQGTVTWYQFVVAVIEAAGGDVARVRPITTAELVPPRPAPRPANSVLANSVLESAGIPLLRDFREPLGELVDLLTRRDD